MGALRRLRNLVARPETPDPAPASAAPEFTVFLERSQREVAVGTDTSVLEALEQAGVEAPHSCRNGICGSCETRVLDGTPVHHDRYLDDDQRGRGRVMAICVSRAAPGTRLVLDL